MPRVVTDGANEILNMSRNPEKVTDVLALVHTLLDVGKAGEAVELMRKYGTESSELSNAYGVALMRAGETAKALAFYRRICLYPDSVCFKDNLPTMLRVNYATALLLEGNVSGCLGALTEVGQEQDPYVRRLRSAIGRWRRSLGWWKRLEFILYGAEPDRPVPLDFPPGDLDGTRRLRPAA